MKLLKQDFKHGIIKLQVENLDDLWYLSTIIEPKDLVSASTVRKIKLGKGEERKPQLKTRKVFLKLEVEKVEFHETTDALRILGVIKEGPEDIPLGSHHTFNIEVNNIITVQKEKWLRYQKEKLIEASKVETPKILMVVFDREQAFFALLKKYGYQLLSEISGEVIKKGEPSKAKVKNFYFEIIEQIEDYVKRYKIERIIVSSPAFWKEEFMKNLKDENLRKKITTATCSSVDKTAFNEILKRTETQAVLKQDRISKELNLAEQLLFEISREGLAAYGFDETKQAAEAGAIKTLLVTDRLIKKMREKGEFDKLDKIMKLVDKSKANIHIICSDNDAGKKLDGLGGIAAILRFKIWLS